jgi:DNA replication protein DnaD
MASYLFASGGLKNFVVIPAAVVDRHLAVCDGDALKVLLYLLRHEDVSVTDAELCAACGIEKKALDSSMQYWLKTGVLRQNGATLTLASAQPSGSSMPVYSGESIAMRATQDRMLAELFIQAERIRCKTLSPAEMNTLYNLYDTIGLPASVIALLLEYCQEAGKTGTQYMYVTGAAWAEEGITTAQAANEKIESLRRARALEGRVKSALGIDRALSTKERGFLSTWTESLGFGLDEIVYAFEQTVDNTGKLSFAYMNKVLQNSYEAGCRTVDDMKNQTPPAAAPKQKKGGRKLKNNSEITIKKEDLFVPFWVVEGEEE